MQALRDVIQNLRPYGPLLREVLQITPYVSVAGVIPLLETRMGDLLRTWLMNDGIEYRPVGGVAGMTGLIRTAVHLTLRHLAEIKAPALDDPFIEATASLLAGGIEERSPNASGPL